MTSETEARRSVAITGAPLQALDAADHGRVAVELDMRAEAGELLHVHETVLEDGLLDARDAFRARHQRHELRLQVGREPRERRRRDVDRADAGAIALHAHASIVAAYRRASLGERVEGLLQQILAHALEHNVAASHRHRRRVGSRFDAVGENAVMRAVQTGDAVNFDCRRAGAADARAHLD